MRILIVKTSALGDILQSFDVLTYLHDRIPNVEIDWIAEQAFLPLLEAHPLIRRAIPFSLSKLRSSIYDVLFDLQGNCKSALCTLLARSTTKVGRGRRSVREWPNLFATQHHFDPPAELNIRLQYINIVQQFFQDQALPRLKPIRLHSDDPLPLLPPAPRIMVCLGSRWPNKRLSSSTALSLLRKFASYSLLLIWGTPSEEAECRFLRSHLPNAWIIPKLSLPCWQNLMYEVDCVFSVDSAALHLCGTTSTPSLGIFGPTSAKIFAPPRSVFYQGICPYNQKFVKQCRHLRTCPTGACIRSLDQETLKDFLKLVPQYER
jgi:heptosyltransferase I